jgi:hypothetical protein
LLGVWRFFLAIVPDGSRCSSRASSYRLRNQGGSFFFAIVNSYGLPFLRGRGAVSGFLRGLRGLATTGAPFMTPVAVESCGGKPGGAITPTDLGLRGLATTGTPFTTPVAVESCGGKPGGAITPTDLDLLFGANGTAFLGILAPHLLFLLGRQLLLCHESVFLYQR